jgi:hypothetical protein
MIDSINLDGLITLISRAIILAISGNYIKTYLIKLDYQYRQPFYLDSHLWHKNKHELWNWFEFEKLDEDLEYSFQISTPENEMPTQVEIKNIGESKIEKISINIVAEGCFDGLLPAHPYDRQEYLEILNLSPQGVARQYLYNIPRDDIWYSEDMGGWISSFEGIYIYLLSKKKDGITQECSSRGGFSIFFSRRYKEKETETEEKNWKTKWGEKYNVSLLSESKQHFARGIYSSLERWPWSNSGGIPVWLKQKISSLCILMLHKKVVNLIFWICLLSGHITLDKYK